MGISISKTLYGLRYNNEKEVKVTMVGIDAAGKTTILYRLLKGETVNTIPTTDCNHEFINYKNLKLNVWDIGGSDIFRLKLFSHFCPISNAIILVINSNDIDRINEARDEFRHIYNDLINEDIPILIYANKQDLPNALSPAEITKKLDYLNDQREWHIQGTCATTGDGLYEGLEWLYQKLNQKEIE